MAPDSTSPPASECNTFVRFRNPWTSRHPAADVERAMEEGYPVTTTKQFYEVQVTLYRRP